MAKLSHADSRRMYSWWWDSHISPQNSRWLLENLTDMDVKVKSMIKLIEQDADSFARRAEMYYEKRPELMKMVEEFYRAYRALAERYYHATGALRQAQWSMTETFPNQVPSEITEDELVICANVNDHQAPDDLYASHNEVRKGLGQFNDSFGSADDENLGERQRKGLEIVGGQEKDQTTRIPVKFEEKIQTLSDVLAKFEAEKESSLAQYKKSLDKLSHQELEFSSAQMDSKGLAERANKAEDEVESLRKALKALEAEKEESLIQYQKCLENIENMERINFSAQKDAFDLNERAQKAETDAQFLKVDLAKVESEKSISFDQCKQSMEKILNLENKLIISEDEVKKLNKRAEEAETEVETLKQDLTELGVEKETTAVQYQQCLDTISSLEKKISCAQEHVQIRNGEVESGVAKLKGAEEQCLYLQRLNQSLLTELETLKLEMGAQSKELTEKKREMETLWKSVEDERMRVVEAETAFQMLQLLQAQSEKELDSLALELENRSLIISELETCNQSLLNEALKITNENESLNELNLASSVSLKDMQNKILSLKEAKEKLEDDVELGADQKNALQQEIHCLKEELNDLNTRYHTMLVQIEAVGFNSDSFQSAVKGLQDENLILKETRETERREKVEFLKKLEDLEKVDEKNVLLEKSLSDLSVEFEGAKEEIFAMVKSIQSLFEEKSVLDSEKASLVTQLQVAAENFEKLSGNNTSLENSVSDAHAEIEGFKMRLKGVEDSCQFLENEKSDLINEKVTLVSQVEITRQRLDDIEKRYRELEEKHSVLDKEKESTSCEVEELRLIVKESKLKEDKQLIEIENLHGKAFDMQKTTVALQEENLKLIDEKISLVKDLLDLQEKNNTFEGENLSILGETASLSNISLIFKNIINEKALEIEELRSTADKLQGEFKVLEEETNAKDGSIVLLQERISTLKGENGEFEAQLSGYLSAINSLKDCISSLENNSCLSIELQDNDEKVKATRESHMEGQEESIVNHKEKNKLSELQELEARVKIVEKTVIETNSKLEAATRQIEERGSKGASYQNNIKPPSVNSKLQNEFLTKDIMLDQIFNMNGEDKISTPTKKGVHFDLGVIEKELGMDKVATANRFSVPNQELDKNMILERLNSDSEKLANLHITMKDLKKKAEIGEKMREGKSLGEYESVGRRLKKAEEDIKELSDLNGYLIKRVDKSDDVKDVLESEENTDTRRKISEQAGKVTEGIGKLEFEVQKIQYIMLKLDGESGKENINRKSEINETKRTFRNYLGLKTSSKTKKRAFCGFVHPPTIED